ncbi:LAETG motif-containing sortase-dependent surface protein [Streptomyces sp. NPDC051207]|uniref:LAETG motif-containing sortase-dependent surface protein n=1 Tax=Streptomyces sp. NPDC051207 TaxID=3154641 RepID=UPI0034236D3A
MSIARRVTARRLLGTGAAALALTAASFTCASSASATGTPGGDGWKHGGQYQSGTGAGTETATDRCQFSLDGTDFYDSVKVDDQNLKPTADGNVHITVRTAADAATCTASLASYLAHGPTFATSGEQVFVDFDTVTVKQGAVDTLDIAVPDAGCFAQIDLYRGAVKYDGELDANDGFVHGELPKGPDRPVIKDKLIAAWNGGTKDCTTETPAPSEPAPSASEPAPSTSAPAPETSAPAEETSPEASAPAESESSSPSTEAPAATPNGGNGDEDLAETGASSATTPIAIGAAALLAAGAGFVVVSRRRRASGS